MSDEQDAKTKLLADLRSQFDDAIRARLRAQDAQDAATEAEWVEIIARLNLQIGELEQDAKTPMCPNCDHFRDEECALAQQVAEQDAEIARLKRERDEATFKLSGCIAENGEFRHEIARLKAELAEARKDASIRDLSTPLEDDLSAKIDETLKYLAMGQGFTLNGIARLLVDVQRRMAADWLEIGRVRREQKELRASLVSQVEALPRYPVKQYRMPDDGVLSKIVYFDIDTVPLSAVLQILKGEK